MGSRHGQDPDRPPGWHRHCPGRRRPYRLLIAWLKDREVQQFVGVNRYQGVLWFNKEAFDQLLSWMLTLATVEISADRSYPAEEVVHGLVAGYRCGPGHPGS